MRERHRLGALQVGVPRHYRVLILLGGLHQRALQLAVRREQFDNGIFAPQFKIGGDRSLRLRPVCSFLPSWPTLSISLPSTQL